MATIPKSKTSLATSLLTLNGPVILSRAKAEQLSKRISALTFDEPQKLTLSPTDGWGPPATPFDNYSKADGVATIPVVGILTKYPEWYDSYLGFTATLSIQACLDNALSDPAVQSIMLLIDCPGGYASGTYELADAIAAADKIKPVYAIVSDTCASGGYLLASQCRSISANDKAFVGCIGVYTVLCDDSKFWSELGINFTVISSGGIKGEGADGSVSQALKDDQQREIDGLYELFVARVAAGREMSIADVRKIADGRAFLAEEAKSLGLIDSVATLDAATATILQETESMTLDEFQTFAKANPDATKVYRDEGHQAGKAAGATEGAEAEKSRFKALQDKYGAERPGFVCEQYAKGNNVTQAASELADVLLLENKQLREASANKPGGQQQSQTTPPPIPTDFNKSQEGTPDQAAVGKSIGESFAKQIRPK